LPLAVTLALCISPRLNHKPQGYSSWSVSGGAASSASGACTVCPSGQWSIQGGYCNGNFCDIYDQIGNGAEAGYYAATSSYEASCSTTGPGNRGWYCENNDCWWKYARPGSTWQSCYGNSQCEYTCQPGTYAAEGDYSCNWCGANTYSDYGATSCLPAQLGYKWTVTGVSVWNRYQYPCAYTSPFPDPKRLFSHPPPTYPFLPSVNAHLQALRARQPSQWAVRA
jgi:hypothetical protein